MKSVWLLLVPVLLLSFQNCSEDMPDTTPPATVAQASNIPDVAPITFSPPSESTEVVIQPGSEQFTQSGTFTVKPYAKLRIEVRGAGGGGGGSNLDAAAGTNGANGSASSVGELVANGGTGGKGTNCAWYDRCYQNFTDASRAAGGTALGGDTNTVGGGAVGSNGGNYGDTHAEDGGNGGLVVKEYVAGSAGAPAVGATLQVVVGAGGQGGVNGAGNAYQNRNATGAAGSVKISW